MNKEINQLIRNISGSVIRLYPEANKPEAVTKFIDELKDPLKGFINQMLISENKNDEYCLTFKADLSAVYDELFIKGGLINRLVIPDNEAMDRIIKLAVKAEGIRTGVFDQRDKSSLQAKDVEALIEITNDLRTEIRSYQLNDSDPVPPDVLSRLIAIKRNGNPLGDSRGLRSEIGSGATILEKFVSTYKHHADDNDPKVDQNEPKTVVLLEYLSLIYHKYAEVIKEDKATWLKRFEYPGGPPVNRIEVEERAKEGSDRLVIIGILSAIQECLGGAFNFDDFALKRFGFKGFKSARYNNKDKDSFKKVFKYCEKLLINDVL